MYLPMMEKECKHACSRSALQDFELHIAVVIASFAYVLPPSGHALRTLVIGCQSCIGMAFDLQSWTVFKPLPSSRVNRLHQKSWQGCEYSASTSR